MNKINEHSILHACNEFQKYISDQGIDFNIDDFSSTNIHIFNREENYYEEKSTYFLFSVMSYILLDLGIIQNSNISHNDKTGTIVPLPETPH